MSAPLATTLDASELAGKLSKSADQIEDALVTANVLLNEALEGRWREPAQEVYDVMVRRVVRALIEGDGRQYTGPQAAQVENGQQVRAPRDPLEPARPLLRAYVVGLA